jgi:hypothetical protein
MFRVSGIKYGTTLYKFVDRALELTRPISGMVAYQRTATLGCKLLYGLFVVLNC